MTPEELDRALWASYKHRESDLRDQMRNAWYYAHLMRQRRLPSLLLWMAPTRTYDDEELARRKAEHEWMVRMVREIDGKRSAR